MYRLTKKWEVGVPSQIALGFYSNHPFNCYLTFTGTADMSWAFALQFGQSWMTKKKQEIKNNFNYTFLSLNKILKCHSLAAQFKQQKDSSQIMP